jgi:hypothetical protein
MSYVHGQRPPFDATAAARGAVVVISFTSPSPLGLLGGG